MASFWNHCTAAAKMKGACAIAMLELLSGEAFRAGIRRYALPQLQALRVYSGSRCPPRAVWTMLSRRYVLLGHLTARGVGENHSKFGGAPAFLVRQGAQRVLVRSAAGGAWQTAYQLGISGVFNRLTHCSPMAAVHKSELFANNQQFRLAVWCVLLCLN